MSARLILALCSFWLSHHLQPAGGPQSFNCEIYEHQNLVAPVLHQAFINYGPLEIIGRHAAIPALAPGVYPLGGKLNESWNAPISLATWSCSASGRSINYSE